MRWQRAHAACDRAGPGLAQRGMPDLADATHDDFRPSSFDRQDPQAYHRLHDSTFPHRDSRMHQPSFLPPYDIHALTPNVCDAPPVASRAGGGPTGTETLSSQPPSWEELKDSAELWLDDIVSTTSGQTADLARRCFARIAALPRDEVIDCFSRQVVLTTTLALEFLGQHWLRDEHIQAGLELIEQQLGVNSHVVFMSSYHLPCLRSYHHRALGSYNPARPQLHDSTIASGLCNMIVVPAHVRRCHWTLFYIDLIDGTIRYADTMYPGSPLDLEEEQMLEDLQWWLASLLPFRPLRLIHWTPPCQTDSHSCGIAVLSSVASELLRYGAWSQAEWREHRFGQRVYGLRIDL